MNNIQLSLLLDSYLIQLNTIHNALIEELKQEGIECHEYKKRVKWIGEGEEPKYMLNFTKDSDWEWEIEKGNPICLDDLSEFIDDMENNIELLRKTDEEKI